MLISREVAALAIGAVHHLSVNPGGSFRVPEAFAAIPIQESGLVPHLQVGCGCENPVEDRDCPFTFLEPDQRSSLQQSRFIGPFAPRMPGQRGLGLQRHASPESVCLQCAAVLLGPPRIAREALGVVHPVVVGTAEREQDQDKRKPLHGPRPPESAADPVFRSYSSRKSTTASPIAVARAFCEFLLSRSRASLSLVL